MKTLLLFGLFVLLLIISWLWVKSIDIMKKKYPDYKGEDFLNEKDENSLI